MTCATATLRRFRARKQDKHMVAERPALSEERIAYLEGLVEAARNAANAFTAFTQADVDRIVERMAVAGMEQAQALGRVACEETRVGVPEDKAIKNMVATEFVYNYI